MKRIIYTLILVLSVGFQLSAQVLLPATQCESQSACNARPVCGSGTISMIHSFQSAAPYNVNPPGAPLCGAFGFTPNWVYYRINCYGNGILNFTITANDAASDLDWAVWDVTTAGCAAIHSTALVPVACNAAGTGLTGIQTGGLPAANFSPNLNITNGNSYILGIARASGGTVTTGFTIDFTGTTALLTDGAGPSLASIVPIDICNPVDTIKVKLSKAARCTNIGVGDFLVNGVNPTSAAGNNCNPCSNAAPNTALNYSAVSDTIILGFNPPLAPGTYTLALNGASGTPFFDICGNAANTTPILTFNVSSSIRDSVRTGFNCATSTYIDTIYGKGGTGPYQYKGAGGTLTNTYGASTMSYNVFTGLVGGTTYTLSARDANGCVRDTVITHPIILISLQQPNLSSSAGPPCNNQFALDSIKVTSQTGGVPPYTWTLATTTPGATTGTQISPGLWKNLVMVAGASYTVTVTDAYGCTRTATRNLTNPPVLVAPTPTLINNPKCFGDSTGSISMLASGGTFPYTYSISPNYAPTMTQSAPLPTVTWANMPAGTYTITVTDNNGCTATSTRTLVSNTAIVIKTTNAPAPITYVNPTCTAPCSGSITPTSSGGVGGPALRKYFKLPTLLPTDSVSGGGSFTGLCAGTYTIMCRDAVGCTATATYTLALPPIPDIVYDSTRNVLCAGGCSGIIYSTTTGGTLPYTYAVVVANNPQCGAAVGFGTGDFQNLPAGTYKVIVSSPNQCKDSIENIIITEPTPLVLDYPSTSDVSCFNGNDGSIEITANGGTGVITYTITPLGPQSNTTGLFSNLTAQCYTVTARDANNCTTTSQICISQPTQLTISAIIDSMASCNGVCDGGITATAGGGEPPYTYSINNGGLIDPQNGIAINLCDGTYTITVTDDNNCTATISRIITEPAVLNVSTIVTSNVSCNGLCDGTGTATGAGGTTAYTYSISGGATINSLTGAITGMCANTNYTVTITDAHLCTATTSISVTQPIVLSVSTAVGTNVSCNGLCDGTGNATAAGGTTAYTYSIAGGGTINASTGAITGLCAGITYTVTVTDAHLCTATSTISVTQPTILSVGTAVVNNVSCNGLCDGTGTATAAGGTTAYSYSIAGGGSINSTTGAITGLCAGTTYTVIVTDANLCTATSTIQVTQPTVLSVTSLVVNNVSCFGLCDGTGTATATGGTTAYTYSISAPAVIDPLTGAISGMCANTNYTVTVTDGNLCTATTTISVTQPSLLSVSTLAGTAPTCLPGCDGTATATASGGTTAYTYSINGGATIDPLTGAITGICAGTTYTVTVTDGNLCTAISTINMVTPNGPVPSVSNLVDASCFGVCDGTAQAGAIGGALPYVYSISGGATIDPNTGAISGLCAGTIYTVTATDDNNCTGTATFTIGQPTILTVGTAVVTNVSCFGLCNGTGTATAAGGTTAYTYSIAGGGSINASTGAITGLCAGITYTVTVTDGNLCTATSTISVTEPTLLDLSTAVINQVSCFGLCDGTGTATASGGTTNYTYSINAPAVIDPLTGAISGMCAGTYTVTVSDANLCTASATIQITEPTQLSVSSLVLTNVSCNGGCDGTGSATATGGTLAYTYSITAPAVIDPLTGAISGMCANTNYTVTVTDGNLCTATTTISVTQPSLLSVSTLAGTAPTCLPGCDGTATATASGGTTAYTYSINGGATIDPLTGAITGICAGTTYTVTVTDGNLCTAISTINMVTPNGPVPSVSNLVDASCFGVCDGTAQAGAVGGALPYVYSISGGATIDPNTGAISGLCATTIYTITVTDDNSCVGAVTFTIGQPTILTVGTAVVTNVSCFGLCNGTGTATAAGGTTAYTYSIAGGGSINASTGAITGLCAGITYTVTVTDGNLCTATSTISVTEPTLLDLSTAVINQVSCFGLCDGTGTATASGGTTNYTYSINAPAVIDPLTGAISGMCAGTYTVTVSDANLCTASATIQITEPTQLSVSSLVLTNVSCNGGCDGTGSATATGGTLAYTYSITAPAVIDPLTGAISGMCANTNYTVTVTDGNLCTATTTISVTQPSLLSVSTLAGTAPTCLPGCDGTATATASGGTTAYTYSINGGATIDPLTGAITGICAGTTYTVTVTDGNLCTAISTINMVTPNGPVPSVSNLVDASCFGVCDGTAQAGAIGGALPYVYSISGGATIDPNTGAISGLCATTIYTITVTDDNSCVGAVTFTIGQPTILTVGTAVVTNVSCFGLCNGTGTATAAGGTTAYTYSIAGGGSINASTGAITGLCAGITYTVTVTDGNLCTATSTISVTEPTLLDLSTAVINQVSCFGLCDGTGTATASGGTTNYTYSINAPAVIDPLTGAISGMCAGTYTVTVSDANLCTASATIQITEPTQLSVSSLVLTNVSCNGGCDGTGTATATGGTLAYTYSITAPAVIDPLTGAISGMCANTNYTVTVTDGNLCTATTTISVTQPSLLSVSTLAGTAPTCLPGCDGTATATASGGTTAYTYSINGGATIDPLTGAITGICAGTTYTVTVTDGNLCTAISTINMVTPNGPVPSVSNLVDASCFGVCDGTAQAGAVGGALPYVYSISGGATIDPNTGAISGLCATTIYTITVTDDNSCVGAVTFTIGQPTILTVGTAVVTNVSCFGLCNGTGTATAAGGTTAYTYSIAGGGSINASTGAITGLCAGITYTVTVTDGNLCTATSTISVTEPTLLDLSTAVINQVSCFGLCDGTGTATASGGTTNYTYSINAPAVIDPLTGAISGMCAGTYTVTVSDANLCTASATIQITEPTQLSVSSLVLTNVSCNGGCDGTGSATATGGTLAYTYSITAPAVIDPLTGAISGMCANTNYTVTVTDGNLCTATTTISVTQPSLLSVSTLAGTAPTCLPGCDGTATATASGGTTAYTYSINGGATIDPLTGAITGICAGTTYTVTVTDGNLCTAISTINMVTPNGPVLSINTQTNPSCNPGCDGTATFNVVGGTLNYNFSIAPSGTINPSNGNASNLCAGITYTITVSDANSCEGTITLLLISPVGTPISVASTTPPSCNPGCDGTATMNPAVGITYTISPVVGPIAGNVINGLCAGTIYTVTGTDANGCAATATVEVFTPSNPNPPTVASTTNESCNPGCDGTATMNPAVGLTYTVSPAAGIPVGNLLTGLCSGTTYTVTGTNAQGCFSTTTVQVGTLPGTPIDTASTTQPSCNPGCDGTATMNPAVGIIYTISPAAGAIVGNVINGLCANITYTVTGTNASGCTSTKSFELFTPNSPAAPTVASSTNASCNPGCDGTVTMNPAVGLVYTITPAATVTANVLSGLCAGTTYTVTGTNSLGCVASTTIQITTAPTPSVTASSTNVTVAGGNNGTATAVGASGTPPYSYSISPNVGAQAPIGTFTGLTGVASPACTTYTITITDAKGCTNTTSVCISEPGALSCSTTLVQQVSCNGICDGSFDANATGGVPAYTFTMLPSPANIDPLTGLATNLCAATYTVTVTDVNSVTCTSTFQITEPTALSFGNPVKTSPSCSPGCDGTINIAAAGGTPGYTYSIAGPAPCSPLQPTPGNFTQIGSGTYTITVVDSKLCTATTTVQVNPQAGPTINSLGLTNLNCNGVCIGQIVVNATGATGATPYSIGSGSQASNIFGALCANNYTVTVTDANGCTITSATAITEPTVLAFSTVTHTDPLCNGQSNGTIDVTMTGGTPNYSYTIAPAAGVQAPAGIFSSLAGGNYTITATDAKGCSLTTLVIVTNPTALSWVTTSRTNITCNGANNGTISVSATGGTPTLEYSLNASAYTVSGNYNALTAGSYTATCKDANGCTLSTVFTISEPPVLSMSAPIIVDVLCNGTASGAMSSIANGGTPGTAPNEYTYTINPGGFSNNTGSFTGLLAGNYTITATDAAGCTKTISGSISQPPVILYTQVNIQNVACYGQPTGSITVSAQGGAGGITFGLNPFTPPAAQGPSGFFSGLFAGNYVITATDANGCTLVTNASVTQNQPLQMNTIVLTEPICNGDANGSIEVTLATGGQSPYQYTLNNGNFQSSGLFSNLVAAQYILTMKDALGCTKDSLVDLTQPLPVGAILNLKDANCVDTKDGKVTVIGTGGRGGYKYYITPGLYINKSGLFSGLAAGSYVLRVVDTAGCEYTTNFVINPPANALNSVMTKIDLRCTGVGNEGTATVNVNGGTPPYVYLWNTTPAQIGPTAKTLYFGFYEVEITDANGCVIHDTVQIEEGPCCDIAFIPNAFSPNGDGNNDEFRVLTTAGVELQQLEIRDRWGKRVWSTNDFKRGWDGKIDGQDGDVATYYYVFRYKCTRDNKTYIKKGDINLIR